MRIAALFFCIAAFATPDVSMAVQAIAGPQESQTTANGSPEALQELFTQFGLFGTWATNCKEPASPQNPYVSITSLSPGIILEDHNLGPDYTVNRYSVLSAKRLSATRLSVDVLFQPANEDEQRQHLVFRVRDGTRRTLFNQPEGGAVRVQDGIVVGRGQKTPLLTKCK